MAWQATGVAADELADNQLRGTVVGNRSILLVRLAGAIYATDGVCPHIGGDLADGTLELGKLTCPLHGATFDVETGAVRADPFGTTPPEGGVEPLPTFPVRLVDGRVEVDLPDGASAPGATG